MFTMTVDMLIDDRLLCRPRPRDFRFHVLLINNVVLRLSRFWTMLSEPRDVVQQLPSEWVVARNSSEWSRTPKDTSGHSSNMMDNGGQHLAKPRPKPGQASSSFCLEPPPPLVLQPQIRMRWAALRRGGLR